MDFDAALDENSVGDQREQLKQSERDLELEISWLHQAIHDRQEVCPEFQKLCIKGEVQRNKACYTYNFIDAAMQFLLRCQTISSSESHQTHS